MSQFLSLDENLEMLYLYIFPGKPSAFHEERWNPDEKKKTKGIVQTKEPQQTILRTE